MPTITLSITLQHAAAIVIAKTYLAREAKSDRKARKFLGRIQPALENIGRAILSQADRRDDLTTITLTPDEAAALADLFYVTGPILGLSGVFQDLSLDILRAMNHAGVLPPEMRLYLAIREDEIAAAKEQDEQVAEFVERFTQEIADAAPAKVA